jgi:uncharacterized protein DUF397
VDHPRDLPEWREVEQDATESLNYETVLILGLLQSPSYAIAVLPSERWSGNASSGPQGRGPHLIEMAGKDEVIVRIVPLTANIRPRSRSCAARGRISARRPSSRGLNSPHSEGDRRKMIDIMKWRKPSYSNGENTMCVEVARTENRRIAARDSTNPHGPILECDRPHRAKRSQQPSD